MFTSMLKIISLENVLKWAWVVPAVIVVGVLYSLGTDLIGVDPESTAFYAVYPLVRFV